MKMIQPAAGQYPAETKSFPFNSFFTWCSKQQPNRLAWLAVIIVLHGCIITPLTLLIVMATGNNLLLWPPVIVAMGASLVTNMAALSTHITLPVFFLSLLIDLSVVAICIAHGFVNLGLQ